ncbi:hypothetical protein [Pleurocapsa sp. CCALA 161]|nr:hypothetical protein [Pleurocapsa sp. CCALA 161]
MWAEFSDRMIHARGLIFSSPAKTWRLPSSSEVIANLRDSKSDRNCNYR